MSYHKMFLGDIESRDRNPVHLTWRAPHQYREPTANQRDVDDEAP